MTTWQRTLTYFLIVVILYVSSHLILTLLQRRLSTRDGVAWSGQDHMGFSLLLKIVPFDNILLVILVVIKTALDFFKIRLIFIFKIYYYKRWSPFFPVTFLISLVAYTTHSFLLLFSLALWQWFSTHGHDPFGGWMTFHRGCILAILHSDTCIMIHTVAKL